MYITNGYLINIVQTIILSVLGISVTSTEGSNSNQQRVLQATDEQKGPNTYIRFKHDTTEKYYNTLRNNFKPRYNNKSRSKETTITPNAQEQDQTVSATEDAKIKRCKMNIREYAFQLSLPQHHSTFYASIHCCQQRYIR